MYCLTLRKYKRSNPTFPVRLWIKFRAVGVFLEVLKLLEMLKLCDLIDLKR